MSETTFTLSFEQLRMIVCIVAIAVLGYAHAEYKIYSVEKENAELRQELESVKADLKFTTNNLMRFQYGEWAVER